MRWIFVLLLASLVFAQPSTFKVGNTSFRVEEVKNSLDVPWAMRFGPDGRLWFTQRGHEKVGVSALDLKTGAISNYGSSAAVRVEGEGGVLGLELDPGFSQNKKLYVCYSYWKNGQKTDNNRRNRVSSFVLQGNQMVSEQVLIDDMLGWVNHNGCRVVWGPDGKIYASIGDAADAPSNIAGEPGYGAKAQSLKLLAGKIFRINPDGTIPSDNPFYNQTSGSARAIWSYGHRNPQGLAFQPGTGVLWSTEHGPNTRDELNIIKKGKNYGWPVCAGSQAFGSVLESSLDGITFRCTDNDLKDNYQPAIREYAGGDQPTVAPSDLVFYSGNAFPQWKGNLFFVTLKTGRLYRLEVQGEKVTKEEILLDNQWGRLRDLAVGPDGFFYISTDNGQILRIRP